MMLRRSLTFDAADEVNVRVQWVRYLADSHTRTNDADGFARHNGRCLTKLGRVLKGQSS